MMNQLSALVSECSRKGIIKKEQKERLEKTLKLVEANKETRRNPQRLGLYIKDQSEKALQRAVYLSSRSCLSSGKLEIVWGDAEVPVSARGKSPRGSCFDLVGNSGKWSILCELKAGRSNDHPIFGALELLVYYAVLVEQKDNRLVFHQNSIAKVLGWPSTNDWKKSILIVAGDEIYWNKWKGWKDREPGRSCFRRLVERFSQQRPRFYKIKISAKDHFSKQKQNAKDYTPCLGTSDNWEEVGEL
ncbi:MAG TPA: hypothetical protein PLO78_08815 [Candidatus Omnitrophota bacterium]|nr:hypothetical protein [Candidatus Omnitrophota bacterium]